MDKVSVVTVTYNCEDVIESTISSILSQSYDNIEFIVIDGKSTDSTLNIVQKYHEKIDYILSEKDRGIFDAMNKGIKVATGDWIVFMNAGDGFANPNALKDFVLQIENGVDIAYGNTIMVCNGYYYYLPPAKLELMSKQMPMQHQSTLVRLSYHKKHLFDLSYKLAGDYNFLYKSYYHDHCKFQYIPLNLSYFDNAGGASKDNHIDAVKECLRFYDQRDRILHILKVEYDTFVYKIVTWIKRKLLGTTHSKEIELMRLKREGIKFEIGQFVSIRKSHN